MDRFLTYRMFAFVVLFLFSGSSIVRGGQHGEEKENILLNADGRVFTFTMPGVMTFKGSYSVSLVRDVENPEPSSDLNGCAQPCGQTQELQSTTGRLLAPVEQSTEDTPAGQASVRGAVLRFEQAQIDLLFRFSQVTGVPGFQAQAGIHNRGATPLRLVSVTPVALEGRVEGNPAEWLVTSLDTSSKLAPSVISLNEIAKPLTIFEHGSLYRGDKKGFLFGPVGKPTAYVQANISHKSNGNMSFVFKADMSNVQVKPGETRWSQQVALFTDPPQAALVQWAEWVAQTHQARTHKGSLWGWNSWSFHGQNVSGNDILSEVDAVLNSQQRLRPAVMEIDRGYRDGNDPKGINDKFPEGLDFYAKRIASTGARPGILVHFMGPPGFSNISVRISSAVRDGFTDIKINQTGLVLPTECAPTKTSFETMRDGFALLRKEAGEGTYLLYNAGRPDRATVGFVDASRAGLGVTRLKIRDAIPDALRSFYLNGRWFAVNSDSYYMGTDIANVSEIAGGWPLVRTWMSMVGLSCGAAITADPWHWESFKPYWRNVEVMTPPARERTEVLDLCIAPEWPRLVGHVNRPWGDMTVALLWNSSQKEQTITLDFAKAGMHPHHRYAVWSFWDNRYLGVAQGSWKTPALGASASQHLCFTDLDADHAEGKPILIGSGLHIYCGAAEIKRVKQRRDSFEIELTDAGARDGDLFIYSHHQPVWKAAKGCTVAEIASAGEYVWRISLVERQLGKPQCVSLGILLPVTQQIWFWLLCGILLASVSITAWRYVAMLRLQRIHALEQERVRIARDMHDEVGSSLTKIGKLASKLEDPTIAETAREVVQAMDEIVWTVNPRNDTLESLAEYIVHFTEDFLRHAGIPYDLDVALVLPDMMLSAEMRHNIFMAVKEALNNAVKHAAPKRIWLSLSVKDDCLILILRDDGCGFNPSVEAVGADGLSNIRQRVQSVGGEISIESEPGRGSTITVRVKLKGWA
jgi:alpha-galactosidase